MNLEELSTALRDHLYVTWVTVHPREGTRVEVGEEFDMQIVVRNRFPEGRGPDFVSVALELQDTPFATLVDEARTVAMADRLPAGATVQRVFRFRATAAHPDDPTTMEPVARVRVRARADLESLSRVETDARLLHAQIHTHPAEPA